MQLATQDGPHDLASMENKHPAETRAPFSATMSTTLRREHRGRSKDASPRVPASQKHWFFIGECKKTHHAAARARFSKGAQRSSESSILPTTDGAHDHVNKQKEHRAGAGAPFSIKMCTARRREAQKCSIGAAKVLPLQRRAPYKAVFGPA